MTTTVKLTEYVKADKIEPPRVNFPESAKRPTVVFTSWRNFAQNLESGTCTLVLSSTSKDLVNKAGEKETRWYHAIYCKHGERAEGYVKIALKGSNLDEKSEYGNKAKLYYDLLSSNHKRYSELKATSDTQEDFDRAYRFISEKLEEAFRIEHPEEAYSIHRPINLKFPIPSNSSEKRHTPEGTEDITPAFEIGSFLAREGRMMVRLSSPWAMKHNNLESYSLGISIGLEKTKYLTDDQLLIQRADREEKRLARKREREEAAEAAEVAKRVAFDED